MTIEQMKARKKELGYSAEMLAELAGIPVSTVRKILGGITKAPRKGTIDALEKVLKKKQGEYTGDDYFSLRQGARVELDSGYFYGSKGILPQEQVDQLFVREEPFVYGSTAEKLPPKKTLADFNAMPEDWRGEFIDGVIYDLARPNALHQRIQLETASQLLAYAKKHKGGCQVLPEMDVRLQENDPQCCVPDISVLCNPDKLLNGEMIIGAPDLIVEILSPSTRTRDLIIKLNKYLNCGVREYWIADPDAREVIRYFFEEDRIAERFSFDEKIPVLISGGELEIDLSDIK